MEIREKILLRVDTLKHGTENWMWKINELSSLPRLMDEFKEKHFFYKQNNEVEKGNPVDYFRFDLTTFFYVRKSWKFYEFCGIYKKIDKDEEKFSVQTSYFSLQNSKRRVRREFAQSNSSGFLSSGYKFSMGEDGTRHRCGWTDTGGSFFCYFMDHEVTGKIRVKSKEIFKI